MALAANRQTALQSGIRRGGEIAYIVRTFPAFVLFWGKLSFAICNEEDVMSVGSPQNTTPSMERRHCVRHKSSSIVVVKLDNNNGGILLNLGTGGLSFQAVTKLNPCENLILHLKLDDSGEAIKIEGSVAWLGPTRKEAGVCFKDLPDRTQKCISEWIAKQRPRSEVTRLKVDPAAVPSLVTSEELLLPPRVPVEHITLADRITEPGPSLRPSTGPLRASAMEDALTDSQTSSLSASLVFPTSISTPIPMQPIHSERHSAGSRASPNEVSPEPSQTIIQPSLPSPIGLPKHLLWREGGPFSLQRLLSLTDAVSGDEWFSPVSKLFPSEWKVRSQRLTMVGIASFFAILVLFLMSTNHRKNLQNIDSSDPSAVNFSPSKAIPPSAPATEPTLKSQQQKMTFSDARSSSVTARSPIPAPPKLVQQAAEPRWKSMLNTILPGTNNNAASEQALADVRVWTHSPSGYYYCTDSPYFEKLRPGSIMKERDALQSGYQPKLGAYCH
jgi:hypothetical protein